MADYTPPDPLKPTERWEDFYNPVQTVDGERILPFYNGPFSQWWPSPFTHDGLVFPTAEHWMMYQKARFFHDAASAAAILETEDPAVAKRLGREVKNFDAETWDAESRIVVFVGSMKKFTSTLTFKRFILATAGSV